MAKKAMVVARWAAFKQAETGLAVTAEDVWRHIRHNWRNLPESEHLRIFRELGYDPESAKRYAAA